MKIKPIPGYGGKYLADSCGGIYSAWNTRRVPLSKPQKMKTHISRLGYERVSLRWNGISSTKLVHRLIARTFIGRSGGLGVNHIDGNKINNCVDNLEYATQQENVVHAIANGLRKTAIGERCARTVISAQDINEIRRRVSRLRECGRAPHGSMKQLAEDYGVTPSALDHISRGNSWSHIPSSEEQ